MSSDDRLTLRNLIECGKLGDFAKTLVTLHGSLTTENMNNTLKYASLEERHNIELADRRNWSLWGSYRPEPWPDSLEYFFPMLKVLDEACEDLCIKSISS